MKIRDLESEDQNKPIWGLNGSADSEIGVPGDVHVGVPKLSGNKHDNLYIPQTWLPICLTDQIPRAQLLASSEFRNSVNNKLIVLVSEAQAKASLQQEGADEEQARLDQSRRAVRDAIQRRSVGDVEEATEIAEAEPKSELSPAFTMFLNNLKEKGDIEALNVIRGRGKFKSAEVRAMIKGLPDKPKVSAFLRAAQKSAQAAG